LPNELGIRPEVEAPFKGNMDIDKLRSFIEEKGKENIPVCMLTITNNSGGGQPVSMQNIRDVKSVCSDYNIPLYLDCCRFAENAYFIKTREPGYSDKSIKEICNEMFSYADGATMSAKKDGLSNTGGFLATNDESLAEQARSLLIITEGFITYGGMTRRDLEALAQGFVEVMDEHYLEYRIGQIRYLGNKLLEAGVPILVPTGGHAVYLDAKRFTPQIAPEHFPAQSILCELYLVGGIRAVEIGSLMFGKRDSYGNHVSPPMELVRLAIPRRVYTQAHTDYVAEACEEVFKVRHKLKGFRLSYETKYLRHFTAKLEYID
jgi:tryptophanase